MAETREREVKNPECPKCGCYVLENPPFIYKEQPWHMLCAVLDEYAPKSNPEPPKPKSILAEAEEIINGPRRDAYGPAEESFDRLAQVLSVVLHRKLREPLTAHDAAMVGVALKVTRESNKPSRDNRLDLCGYAALADLVAPKG